VANQEYTEQYAPGNDPFNKRVVNQSRLEVVPIRSEVTLGGEVFGGVGWFSGRGYGLILVVAAGDFRILRIIDCAVQRVSPTGSRIYRRSG
jgi:hypothetical protein